MYLAFRAGLGAGGRFVERSSRAWRHHQPCFKFNIDRPSLPEPHPLGVTAPVVTVKFGGVLTDSYPAMQRTGLHLSCYRQMWANLYVNIYGRVTRPAADT